MHSFNKYLMNIDKTKYKIKYKQTKQNLEKEYKMCTSLKPKPTTPRPSVLILGSVLQIILHLIGKDYRETPVSDHTRPFENLYDAICEEILWGFM